MEFSENSYTKKDRSRIKTITEIEKKIKKIKNSDRQIKIRIRKSVKELAAYLAADKNIQKLLL
jgi:hypothetical protein